MCAEFVSQDQDRKKWTKIINRYKIVCNPMLSALHNMGGVYWHTFEASTVYMKGKYSIIFPTPWHSSWETRVPQNVFIEGKPLSHPIRWDDQPVEKFMVSSEEIRLQDFSAVKRTTMMTYFTFSRAVPFGTRTGNFRISPLQAQPLQGGAKTFSREQR